MRKMIILIFCLLIQTNVFAANRYWVGGTGNWSDDTNHWSTSSGGSGGAGNLPTSTDDVFINSSSGFGSGGTITLDVSADCNSFLANSGHSYVISNVAFGINVYGSATFESGLTFDVNCEFSFLSTTNGKTITSNGCALTIISFYGVGGGWTLQDDLVASAEFYQDNGTFDANGHNVTANDFYFYADTGFTPTVVMGSGTWEATGTGNIWTIDEVAATVSITPNTSTIKITNASASTKNLSVQESGVGKTYNNIWFTGAGSGNLVIQGSNTFNDFKVDTPPHTVIFTAGTTQTVTTFTVSGTAGNLITLDSDDGVTQFTLSKSSGTVSCDYLDISDSSAGGGASWYAGTHSNNTTNNSGWTFTDPPGGGGSQTAGFFGQ